MINKYETLVLIKGRDATDQIESLQPAKNKKEYEIKLKGKEESFIRSRKDVQLNACIEKKDLTYEAVIIHNEVFYNVESVCYYENHYAKLYFKDGRDNLFLIQDFELVRIVDGSEPFGDKTTAWSAWNVYAQKTNHPLASKFVTMNSLPTETAAYALLDRTGILELPEKDKLMYYLGGYSFGIKESLDYALTSRLSQVHVPIATNYESTLLSMIMNAVIDQRHVTVFGDTLSLTKAYELLKQYDYDSLIYYDESEVTELFDACQENIKSRKNPTYDVFDEDSYRHTEADYRHNLNQIEIMKDYELELDTYEKLFFDMQTEYQYFKNFNKDQYLMYNNEIILNKVESSLILDLIDELVEMKVETEEFSHEYRKSLKHRFGLDLMDEQISYQHIVLRLQNMFYQAILAELLEKIDQIRYNIESLKPELLNEKLASLGEKLIDYHLHHYYMVMKNIDETNEESVQMRFPITFKSWDRVNETDREFDCVIGLNTGDVDLVTGAYVLAHAQQLISFDKVIEENGEESSYVDTNYSVANHLDPNTTSFAQMIHSHQKTQAYITMTTEFKNESSLMKRMFLNQKLYRNQLHESRHFHDSRIEMLHFNDMLDPYFLLEKDEYLFEATAVSDLDDYCIEHQEIYDIFSSYTQLKSFDRPIVFSKFYEFKNVRRFQDDTMLMIKNHLKMNRSILNVEQDILLINIIKNAQDLNLSIKDEVVPYIIYNRVSHEIVTVVYSEEMDETYIEIIKQQYNTLPLEVFLEEPLQALVV